MANPLAAPLTLEEFFEWESLQSERHELHRGRILAMAGASHVHVRLSAKLARLCGNALDGSPCEFFGQDAKISVAELGSIFLPDGGIACPLTFSNPNQGVVECPRVLFEVLSPGTEARDRGEKFFAYQRLACLQDYVLISTIRPCVEVFSRHPVSGWHLQAYLEGAIAHIPSVNLDIDVADLYLGVVFDTAS